MSARIYDSFADIDLLSTPPAVTIKGSALREGMVLLDPDLGTPSAGLDQRVRAVANTGHVAFLVHDFETGKLATFRLSPRVTYQVAAA